MGTLVGGWTPLVGYFLRVDYDSVVYTELL